MDNTTVAAMLGALQDPAGIPSPPWIFQSLMVLTWAFHIAFVNLSLGSGLLAVIGFYLRRRGAWGRLSVALTGVAKIAVSMAIVLGVAPLLFTQTIYDPSWYTSNVLSAFWVIFFIFSLGIGYTLWFVFYHHNHSVDPARALAKSDAHIWWAVIALLLLTFDGFIMHVLAYQGLFPQHWLQWYAPHGVADMRGTGIHAWDGARFAFFMVMSLTMTGIFLLGYARYYRARHDMPRDLLELADRVGRATTQWGVVLQLASGLLWAARLPVPMHAGTQPLLWLTLVLLVGIALYVRGLRGDGADWRAYAAMALYAALALVVSIDREALRMAYLAPFHYDIHAYKVNADWNTFGLFVATFVGVGGSLLSFYLSLLWQAGRTVGPWTAGRGVARLGDLAVWINFSWLAVFFGVGLWAYLRRIA